MEEFKTADIIIDNGSGFCKAGFSCEKAPSSIFPEIIGRPKRESPIIGEERDAFFGDDAQWRSRFLNISRTVEGGLISNWNDIEKIWLHTIYNELRVLPEEHNLLLTESPLNTKTNREKIVQIIFESVNIPSLILANRTVLPLYAAGKTTGIVVQSGFGITNIISIKEGHPILNSLQTLNFAGEELTIFLNNLLREQPTFLNGNYEKEIVNDVKESVTFIVPDFQMAIRNSLVSNIYGKCFYFPGGHKIIINNERFRCPELLFNPEINNRTEKGIHILAQQSIQQAEIDLQKELCNNLVLSGGTTMIEGFSERIHHDLSQSLSSKVTIVPTPNKKYAAWVGGAIVSSKK